MRGRHEFSPTLHHRRRYCHRRRRYRRACPAHAGHDFAPADQIAGAQLFFKCENFQRIGAFKFRGAYNAIAQLSAEQRRAGVIAFSSGNHAQAMALAARELGVSATIVMPHDAPAAKLAATRGYGANVVIYQRHSEDREEITRRPPQSGA